MRWRVWLSALLVGTLAAVVMSALAPVKYTATATAFVTVAGGDSGSSEIFDSSQFAVQRVKSYASLVDSPRVLQPVIDDLDLEMNVTALAENTELSSPPDTVLMDVSIIDADAKRARTIANAVTTQLGAVIEDLETVRRAGRPSVRVSVTEAANVPADPSSPRWALNLLLGAVGGLSLGLIGAVLRHRLDQRIKSASDLRELTSTSPLGVTRFSGSWRQNPLAALDWRSETAEGYRTIRTALKFATIDNGIGQVVVSSAGTEESKTTTACNLAISWAQSGASVCLVEADLRRPKVAEYLGVEGNPGLSDVLVGEATLSDVLIAWNHGMLTVLPAGSLPPDPTALLGSDAMRGLVADLAERFDIVIYDSPPMLPVADTVVLGEQVDGLVLAVRHGTTKRENVLRCAEAAKNARVTLFGCVLTCVRGYGRDQLDGYRADGSLGRPELVPLAPESAGIPRLSKP